MLFFSKIDSTDVDGEDKTEEADHSSHGSMDVENNLSSVGDDSKKSAEELTECRQQ